MSDSAGRRQFILYDYLQVAGGAERLTQVLAEALPDFQMVVSQIYPDYRYLADPSSSAPLILSKGIDRLLGRIPAAIFNFSLRAQFLRDADTVLYSGFYAPLAVRHQRRGYKIYYCHTPPRYAFDLKQEYLDRLQPSLRPGFKVFAHWIKKRYLASMYKMDRVIANSNNVRSRLLNIAGIDAEVVHPPIDTDLFCWLGQGNYYVSTARLEPNKRVDLIVEAFRRMPDQRLIVLSGGSAFERLKIRAGKMSNIHFTGWQTDEQLRRWIGRAIATLYIPVNEDFGMSPVESMAAGKPVIGVAEGGLLETILDGKTGILLPAEPTVDHIVGAVRQLTAHRALAMKPDCKARARLFSRSIFIDQMRTILKGTS
ncbi:MAG: glycosyltransferase [Candidatus Competibacter sp.]|nr:glycosyltransferase [Candidatus Competibacter sp.]MDG4582714.1 glycosyltransferase [Candidatus Competibacter sp.]